MMDMMNGHFSGGWMGGMWFLPVLFLVLIIAGVVLIIRWSLDRNLDQGHSPQEILKKRYTRGEIDIETYRDCGGSVHVIACIAASRSPVRLRLEIPAPQLTWLRL